MYFDLFSCIPTGSPPLWSERLFGQNLKPAASDAFPWLQAWVRASSVPRSSSCRSWDAVWSASPSETQTLGTRSSPSSCTTRPSWVVVRTPFIWVRPELRNQNLWRPSLCLVLNFADLPSVNNCAHTEIERKPGAHAGRVWIISALHGARCFPISLDIFLCVCDCLPLSLSHTASLSCVLSLSSLSLLAFSRDISLCFGVVWGGLWIVQGRSN